MCTKTKLIWYFKYALHSFTAWTHVERGLTISFNNKLCNTCSCGPTASQPGQSQALTFFVIHGHRWTISTHARSKLPRASGGCQCHQAAHMCGDPQTTDHTVDYWILWRLHHSQNNQFTVMKTHQNRHYHYKHRKFCNHSYIICNDGRTLVKGPGLPANTGIACPRHSSSWIIITVLTFTQSTTMWSVDWQKCGHMVFIIIEWAMVNNDQAQVTVV